MTISSTTRKAGPFTGTGLQTVFPFAFKVFAAADVLAVLALTSTGVETPQVLTTNYTVALNADQNASPGGNLTMLVAPPAGTTLTLTSQVANTQSTDLTNAGGFYPRVINDALDRLTILTQQLAEKVGRGLGLSLSGSEGVSTVLPNPVALAIIGWNAGGTALQNFAGTASASVSLFMAPVVAAVNAAAARLALGAAASGANTDITSLSILPGQLFGCNLSTAGASTTMSISAGRASDSTGVQSMVLTAIAKTTAAWAVGTAAGGLDTGAIAVSTSYHFYVIRRPDTGVTDVLFSLSATAPTLPANYTQFRLIASWTTTAASQWTKVIQDGDLFMLDTPVLDISTGTTGAAAFNCSLASIPNGRRLGAMLSLVITDTAGSDAAYVSDLSTADLAPSGTAAPGMSVRSYVAGNVGIAPITVMTSTARSVRARIQVGAASCAFRITTLGWIDTRGRNA